MGAQNKLSIYTLFFVSLGCMLIVHMIDLFVFYQEVDSITRNLISSLIYVVILVFIGWNSVRVPRLGWKRLILIIFVLVFVDQVLFGLMFSFVKSSVIGFHEIESREVANAIYALFGNMLISFPVGILISFVSYYISKSRL